MATESSEMEMASEEAASAPPSTSNPKLTTRLEAHKRAQQENMSHMAKIFEILERAKSNLKELERQRLSHVEGLRKLRARLFQENEELRLTAAAMTGGSVSEPPTTSMVLPGSSKSVTRNLQAADTISISSYPRRRSSSKSVTIVKAPSKSLSLATSEASGSPPPRAKSSGSLHRKRSQRSYRRSKHRMLPSNQESVSAISEASQQSATARNLKQRLLSNFKYLN